ncbi:MAG: hypothetical protein D6797_02090 [Bdellovibrio sp.]|nr:MAG: hypothetical protein D6797_02090 [Bdellovibrio sp.]
MQKELNHQIFEGYDDPSSSAPPQTILSSTKIEGLLTQLSKEILSLKLKIKEQEKVSSENTRKIQVLQNHLYKLQQNLRDAHLRLEKQVKTHLQDTSQKLAVLKKDFKSQLLSEEKIQALIDRHNQNIQRLEVRLQQTQKLINEQELQLLNYKAYIQELRKS